MTALTARQLECLRLIGERVAFGKPAPTLREIGAGMCIGSTNCVSDYLKCLERKGMIRLGHALRSRDVELTEAGREALGLGAAAGASRVPLLVAIANAAIAFVNAPDETMCEECDRLTEAVRELERLDAKGSAA